MITLSKGSTPGRYRYRNYLIEKIKTEGEAAYWQVTNRAGKNWISNFPTLREVRAYLEERYPS